MSTKLCSLIIVSPDDPNIWKIHISRQAIVILAIAFLLSFCVTVAVTSSVDDARHAEADYGRLQAENRTLAIETKNAEVGLRKLNLALSEMEEQSDRIEKLFE